MSMIFRTIASMSRTLAQTMAPAAILMLAIIIYTGFAIPTTYIPGWSRWNSYIDPIAYGFEALMINEFHNRNFACSLYVPAGPGYDMVAPANRVCHAVGSTPGSGVVNETETLLSLDHVDIWIKPGTLTALMVTGATPTLWAVTYASARVSPVLG
ncbi:Multidrug resistance protein [Elasticomyces elasticus]|nr:Multidrug resistance protein [Elasticomyces elasticus]